MIIRKQQGIATVVVLSAIAISFGVGIVFQHFTRTIDHPAEQLAEQILDDYGYEIDFSKAKKALHDEAEMQKAEARAKEMEALEAKEKPLLLS